MTENDGDGSDNEIGRMAKFYSRRSFVHSNNKKTKSVILESIPHYKEFVNLIRIKI
jgi:hypothetical protein